MDRLFRLFRVQRGRGLWNPWLGVVRRRRNNNAIWTLVSVSLGAVAAAMLGTRQGGRMAPMTQGPMRNVIRGLNRWMSRRMGTTRPAAVEFAEGMTPERPGNQQDK
ncbi:hypothetical protein FOI67_10115 [Geobacillus sp. LEMMJ02]|uniref:hypothetical protein n=1 Tax=Geobacillus TaxID=129337 RepID=UPI000420A5F6|nr:MULTISPECIES: hypothetical protein [Geobacillus]OPX03901.1 hypothetical protein B1A75_05595 [Geobacillus sp. LEMMY01]TRY42763.1 hypothetical protein FOI67_10115 [Geobacillus sp. LEMMJ02]